MTDREIAELMAKTSMQDGWARAVPYMVRALAGLRANGFVLLGPGSLSTLRHSADELTDAGRVKRALEVRELVRQGEARNAAGSG